MIQPKPYPWDRIDRVPRSAIAPLRAVRQALNDRSDAAALASAAASILGEPVRLLPGRVRPWLAHTPMPVGALALLSSPDASFLVLLCLEPALAARITATLLGRVAPWVDDTQPAPALVQATVGAFSAAVARRAVRSELPNPAPPMRLVAVDQQARQRFAAADGSSQLTIDVTAIVGDDAFSVSVFALLRERPTSGELRFDLAALASMGDTPLELRVVASCSAGMRDELETMRAGDAWLPGDGWTIRRDGPGLQGTVLLCAQHGELALPANLHADGRIVLGEGVMQVDADAKTTDPDEVPAAGADTEPTAADVIAEAPVVVRVELGAVTLSAREWAALQPGDVVMTGTRIAERAVLRIGGVAVAQGELVDVDGELGVRIHARTTSGGAL